METFWVVKRNFIQFLKFHEHLSQIYRSLGRSIQGLPQPPRKYWHSIKDKLRLTNRVQELNRYFKELKQSEYYELYQTYDFLDFFGFATESSLAKINPIHLVDQLGGAQNLVFSDLCVEKQNEACEWIWVIVKSVLKSNGIKKSSKDMDDTNLKMQSTGLQSYQRGSVVGYYRKRGCIWKTQTPVISIDQLKAKVSVVDYDAYRGVLAVGTVSGRVYCFKISRDNIGEYKLMYKSRAHG